ncbi:hypothetical protein DMP17_02495 [Pseudonocardia sp. TMWB2A]|uniref:hypothetical protein n=1 Tax=Pseudonocardia sp. TMWB2A TaxID=687430 RepID=UPI00307CF823
MAHDPNNSIIDNIGDEVKGMAKDGLNHPSTKPVLTGAAVGAAAGFLLPVLTIPVGLLGGAAFMLYQRAKR